MDALHESSYETNDDEESLFAHRQKNTFHNLRSQKNHLEIIEQIRSLRKKKEKLNCRIHFQYNLFFNKTEDLDKTMKNE